MTDRQKPGVAFWTTVMVVTVLASLYLLGFGPVLAYYRSGLASTRVMPLMRVYTPVLWLRRNGPEPLASALEEYVSVCGYLWTTNRPILCAARRM